MSEDTVKAPPKTSDQASSLSNPKKSMIPPEGSGIEEEKTLDEVHLEEEEEDEEAIEALEEQSRTKDPLTAAFEKHFLIEGAGAYKDYTEDRFPRDENGDTIKVSYLFLFKLIIVDLLDDGTKEGVILARKYALEALGFKYTWALNSEIRSKKGIPLKILFEDRLKPSTKEVPWPNHKVNQIMQGERLVIE